MLASLNGGFILDLYAAIIKAIEFGEKSWVDSFQDLEHMVLGMRPYAQQYAQIGKTQKVGGDERKKDLTRI